MKGRTGGRGAQPTQSTARAGLAAGRADSRRGAPRLQLGLASVHSQRTQPRPARERAATLSADPPHSCNRALTQAALDRLRVLLQAAPELGTPRARHVLHQQQHLQRESSTEAAAEAPRHVSAPEGHIPPG
jgi:hypothetical protein